MRRLGLVAAVLISLFAGTVPGWGQPAERIQYFRSHVTIAADASLTVTETIRVQAAGAEIRRGILRDFPTSYTGPADERRRVGFEVLAVRRDGQPEPYAVVAIENGARVRIGHADRFLPPGTYTYEIVYRTDRQIGFFADYDELYWNATGNAWTFRIDQAEAVIDLPPGATVRQFAAYTGPTGAREQDFTTERPAADRIVFRTARPLRPGSGLTVAVAWPKGFVRAPSGAAEAARLLSDNAALAVAAAGFVLVLAYYGFIWLRVGRDPARGTVIPLFEPPKGLSPAAMCFVSRMGFDDTSFAAAIVSLAVKGVLRIDDDGERFRLERTSRDESALSPGERAVVARLFAGGDGIELKQANHRSIGGARAALRAALKNEHEKVHFVTNLGWFIGGAALSAAVAVGSMLVGGDDPQAAFLALWLAGWTAGCVFLAFQVYRRWEAASLGSPRSLVGALFLTVFAIPFFAAEIIVIGQLGGMTPLPFVAVLGALGLVNAAFFHLLKAPTAAGRALLDRIEGFRLYLSVAERERLNALHPPRQTPELFERYLPYALALGVAQEWGEQFADVIAAAAAKPEGYRPRWYAGQDFTRLGAGDFSSRLGDAFAGAVAASASAPGSSSGSGGGGSSGGGGGGGGGSGW